MKSNYKISMKYDEYIIHHEELTAIDLMSEGNSIIFYTNKETINYLDLNNINYIIESNFKEKIKDLFIFKKFILFGVILVMFGVYLNTYRVQNITFNIDTPINSVIEERIREENKRILLFDFVKIDYQELSKDLRSEYPCYEWISVKKEYDVIEVEIIKTGLDNKYEDTLYGDIVATKEGIVESYLIHSGDVMIERNSYVKEGDILIKGSYYDTVVSPKGLVLAHTFELDTYKIYKEVKTEELTSLSNSFYQFNILNNLFNLNKTKYNSYQVSNNELFKLPYLFSFNKVTHLEQKEVTYYYDKDTAEEYGQSKVVEKFNNNKVTEEEKLENIIVYSLIEKDEYFEITYLVKKLESIGVFKEYSN